MGDEETTTQNPSTLEQKDHEFSDEQKEQLDNIAEEMLKRGKGIPQGVRDKYRVLSFVQSAISQNLSDDTHISLPANERFDDAFNRGIKDGLATYELEEKEKSLSQAKEEKLFDALSKVRNKAGYESYMDQITENDTGTLLAIDLDLFKRINDTYGHLAGDFVIEQAAARMKHLFKEEDCVARTGGDEFTIFMKGVEDVKVIHERIRKLRESVRQPYVWKGINLEIDISAGYAPWSKYKNKEETRQAADALQYKVKAAHHSNKDYEYEVGEEDETHDPRNVLKELAEVS